MEVIVQTNDLTKVYKKHYAVKNVNMTICRGDIYGFVGENGAGKTTIIRLLTGVANPTAGDFTIFGAHSKSKEILVARKKMSAVVESPSLYLTLDAYDNLLLQCKVLGIDSAQARIDEVLGIVGLEYLREDKKLVKNFSLGMRQRLGLAIALIGNPELIILDEPMNGLDPEGIIEIRELIIKLNQEKNITFIISSHILSELSRVANKYGFIHHGEFIQEISAAELQHISRKCLDIIVDNNELAKETLVNLAVQDYKLLGSKLIRIYDEVDIMSIFRAFDKEKITIERIYNKDENIEEYYMKLIGGHTHD